MVRVESTAERIRCLPSSDEVAAILENIMEIISLMLIEEWKEKP